MQRLVAKFRKLDSSPILVAKKASMSIFIRQNTIPGAKGVLLEDLTWPEAENVLGPDTIIVIPIGAAAKEHGPHLKLKNDWLLVEYLKREILISAEVVIAPTLNYQYYPAFIEYPGSISLGLETARDLMVDICRSLARFGPRRFYALNTGVSTMKPLGMTAKILSEEKVELRYTNILRLTESLESQLQQQEGGTHADEIETSMMLFIAPSTVDMSKAIKDYHPAAQGGLTRDPNGRGCFSASGIYGDASLATQSKGEIIVRSVVAGILQEIREFRNGP